MSFRGRRPAGIPLPPGARARVRSPGLGGLTQHDPNAQPPGFYNEETVFNERGPEGFELINGPKRLMTQFPFNLAAGIPQRLVAANHRRFYLIIQNHSAADIIFIGFGAAVNAASGFGLIPGAAAGGGGNFFGDYMVPTDDVFAFCANAASGVCGEGVLIA
jgi:hypothetical protein